MKSLSVLARKPLGVAAVLAALAPFSAQAQSRAGALECKLAPSAAALVVQTRTIDCYFDDDTDAPPAHYVGTLTNIGAVAGVAGQGELAWGVLAATGAVGPGALAGKYVGPHGSFALGAGGGASVLVGGSHDTVTLQPVTVQVGTGLNVAAGIQELTLQYVPEPAAVRKHHRHHHHHHHHHHRHHHH
jgi:hypothetical protein